jgi:hypothetical protein
MIFDTEVHETVLQIFNKATIRKATNSRLQNIVQFNLYTLRCGNNALKQKTVHSSMCHVSQMFTS